MVQDMGQAPVQGRGWHSCRGSARAEVWNVQEPDTLALVVSTMSWTSQQCEEGTETSSHSIHSLCMEGGVGSTPGIPLWGLHLPLNRLALC